MKRNTLTKNLKEMVERARHVFLPVSILKIFVHGSYLRGDELPGDLDIIILAKVKEDFEQWYKAFESLSECHGLIVECYEKGMTLEDVFRGPLANEIEKRNIPMEWVATTSWSELLGQTGLCMPYMLNWDKITRRLLTKGMKGIHIQFETNAGAFTPVSGRLCICREIPLFAIWSNESPKDCVLEPTKTEYEGYLKLENEKLDASLSDAHVRKKIAEFLIRESLSLVPSEKLGEVALRVLWNTPKYEVSEEKLREILRKFGIPEDRVYAIRHRGTKTWYKLARNEEEEAKLKAEVAEREEKNAMELTIQKILRKVISRDQASKVDCRILELEKGNISIDVTKPAAMGQESFRRIWESRGFKVEDYGIIYAEKAVTLPIKSNKDRLSEKIRQMLIG